MKKEIVFDEVSGIYFEAPVKKPELQQFESGGDEIVDLADGSIYTRRKLSEILQKKEGVANFPI